MVLSKCHVVSSSCKMDLRLRSNRTMCIVGPSHSGKTHLTLQLLDQRHVLFDMPPRRVVWCYGIYQHDLHQELARREYVVHAGIVSAADIEPCDIIVLDDLLNESRNSQDVTAMFTKAAHHKPCFIIFIMQNLFPSGKEARTRSLNTHYYIIFKNPRDKSQVEFLARQILPRKSKALIEVFEAATEKPHQYLFLDFTQECPDAYRFRSRLFEKPMVIYKVS